MRFPYATEQGIKTAYQGKSREFHRVLRRGSLAYSVEAADAVAVAAANLARDHLTTKLDAT